MIRKTIDVPFDKIDTVYHLADIHIRNLKRHKEYREVFNELYNTIKQDTKNSIIYVGGDVAHAKTDLSPELVDMVSKFFEQLGEIAPTIVITGNHDCNLNNPDRLDALNPIIENLKHPNLHYLRESGIYTIADTDFVVFSVFDEPSNFITSNFCHSDTKVVLYHGVVDGSIMDSGMKLKNDRVTLAHFNDYDISMLGDIHKQQWLNDEKTIAYSSSLIQQNHGEDYKNHGIIKWNMKNRKGKFIPIKNNYGFYTLYIKDNKIPNIENLPKYPRLRVKVENSLMSNVKRIVADVKKQYNVRDIVVDKVDEAKIQNADTSMGGVSVIGDINNIEYQNQLISDYLDFNYHGVTDEILEMVVEINKDLNSKLKTTDYNTGVSWKLKTLEFSNLFSYGENNFVDFTNMNGLHGLFAPNTSGKSALMDVLLFALFDKSSRAFKPSDMLNVKKDYLHSKINFELNGEDYWIEKTGKKMYSTQTNSYTVPVKTDFCKITTEGKKVSLNGEDRRYSNENIREYLGSISNAMLTSFSLQDEHAGIILKSNSERKSLMNSFVGIDVFGKLFEQGHLLNKDIQTLLKTFERKDYATQLAKSETEIENQGKIYKTRKNELSKSKRHKGIIETNLIKWSTKLEGVKTIYDIKELNKNKVILEKNIKLLIKEKNNIQKETDNIRSKAQKVSDKSKNYNDEEIRDNFRSLEKYEKQVEKYTYELEKINIHLKHNEERLENFGEVEYDPECEFCIDNVNMFYNDIAVINAEYENGIKDKNGLESKLKDSTSFVKKYLPYRKKLEVLEQIQLLKQELTNDYSQKKSSFTLHEHKIEIENNKLKDNGEEIEEYYKNQQAIENNKKVQLRIDQLQQTLDDLNEELEEQSETVQQIFSKVEVAKNTRDVILEQMKEMSDLEIQNQAYEYYLKATHRNGIPHELIKKVIPVFESEINDLLSQLVDFTINVDIDDKYINFKIVYDDIEWPLELTSGMEMFISSIAIRHALIKISNKPQPNFLFIDEGWGKLDASNLSQVYILFEYLKGQYDLILIVSHIEDMKDVIDQLLSISKLNGFSHVDNRV